MDEFAEFIGFAIIEAPQGGILLHEPMDHWSHTIMSSTISDANADRWEQIMDWMVSDEGYFSRNMGRPDRHWEMGADGMPIATWDTDDDGNPVHPNAGFEHDWIVRRLAGNSDAFDFFYNPAAMHPLSREIAMRALAVARGDYGHEIIMVERDTALMFFTGDAFLGTGALMNDIEDAIMAGMVESDIDAFWQDFIDSRWHLIEPVLNELNTELLGR